MTKQEKIQHVYGKYWSEWKEDINDNGFLETTLPLPNIMIKELELKRHTICTYTPIELIGIEDNNGWTKIESESDLPKEDCRCEFIKESGKKLYGRFENRMGGLFIDESLRFESPEYRTESITHWKKIESFQLPIY